MNRKMKRVVNAKILISMLLMVGMIIACGITSYASTPELLVLGTTYSELPKAWQALMGEYKVILAGITGLGTMTSVLVFIIHIVKMGAMPSNPKQRRSCIIGMFISGVTTALLGGITMILTVFYATIFL